METCTFKSVLYTIGARLDLDPWTEDGLPNAKRQELVALINVRFQEGWEFEWWSDLMICEERDLTTDGTTSVRYVPWVASGKTTLSRSVLGVYRRNPLESRYPDRQYHKLNPDGVVVDDLAPDPVHVLFRKRHYDFTADVYDSKHTYAADDVVFYLEGTSADGRCYKALQAATGKDPASETTYWEELEFPKFLRGFVIEAVVADKQGQSDEDAYDKLVGAADVYLNQAGQNTVARVRVC